ncbi:hypothetical protein [Streptosporangium sp. NBC_01469]|uniref:hypothetical protein n=1 Tax=Streptosporangium sp. NBC_01469 TaxID=2903898 RepID=UPI002E2A434A|nr:hypothetical protein [Streptosporangium sp. NBC_01469]
MQGTVSADVQACPYKDAIKRIFDRPPFVVRGAGLSVVNMVVMVSGSFDTDVAVILQREPASADAAFTHTFVWAPAFTALAVVPALLLPGRVRAHLGLS